VGGARRRQQAVSELSGVDVISEAEQVWLLIKHRLRREMWRRILIADEPLSSKELAEETRAPLANAAYHMSVLLEGDAITLVKKCPRRGSFQRFYGPTVKFDRRRVLAMIAELNGESSEGA
jgi:hypothetical protein